MQIWPRHCRFQVSTGGAPTLTSALVHLKVSIPKIVTAVEFGNFWNTGFLSRLAPGIQDFPVNTSLFYSQFSTDTVKFIRAVLIIFRAFEYRQYVLPTPATITLRRPVVIITLLAAHINHGIDRRATTQHLATSISNAAIIESYIGFCVITPVGAWIGYCVEITDGNVDPEIVVLTSSFQQQYLNIWVRRESIGQHAACSAGADDDVIILTHGRKLAQLAIAC